MNLNEFKIVSSFLDPIQDQSSIHVKACSLNGIPSMNTQRLCQLFFQGRDEILLTRNDVFRSRRRGLETFLVSVLFWGFPHNQHRVCTYAFCNWDVLVGWVNQVRNHPAMTSLEFEGYFPIMNGIRGLGISTYSKILYFLNASVDGYPCLILDNYVAKGIANLVGNEFAQLQVASNSGRYRYYANYLQYLEASSILAQMNRIPEINVEYTLWIAGKKNR